MLAILKDFWRAVSHVFPDAWNKPSRKSRLMHGVGIASLGVPHGYHIRPLHPGPNPR